MGNVRSANTYYIDTQYSGTDDSLTLKNVRIVHVTVTATSANAVLVLKDDSASPITKADLRVATSGESKPFDFKDHPLVFPNGIRPVTLTNAIATCTIVETGGG